MNIEASINLLEWANLNKLYIETYNECDYHNIHTAIETLLTAYEEKCKELKKEIQDNLDVRNRWGLTLQELEKEKGENVKLRLQDIPLIEGELKAYKDRVSELKQEVEKEKRKIKN